MALLALPTELVTHVAHFLPTERDLNTFSQTCRRIYGPVNLALYRRNQGSNTALTWGARKNIPAIFQHAVDAGIDIRECRLPLLFDAALRGHARVLEALLSQWGLKSFQWAYQQDTPLTIAILNDHTRVVRVLLDYGADPSLPLPAADGETPLHYVARRPRPSTEEMAAMMIDASTNIAPIHADDGTPLHVAACHGFTSMVAKLLDRGADYAQLDPCSSTPLGLAVWGGHMETTRLLLGKCPDTTGHFTTGEPMLCAVAGSCTKEMMMLLLQHGADPNESGSEGAFPLQRAAEDGNMTAVRILLDHGAVVDAQCSRGRTALHEAVYIESVDTVKLLLEAGANTLGETMYGDQALHMISPSAPKEIVDMLLDHGADVTAKNGRGQSPVAVAVKSSRWQVAKALVERGADVNDNTGGSPLLLLAAEKGDDSMVAFLHERGANIGAVDDKGRTALHIAVQHRHNGVLQFLLDHGADVQVKDSSGWTPLQYASAEGLAEDVDLLIAKGANLESVNSYGNTALHIAAEHDNFEVVDVLLASGANELATNAMGWTPAMVAATCMQEYDETFNRLLESGKVDIDQRDIDGRTALFLASMRGKSWIVTDLLSRDPAAASDTKDRYGSTPLIMAARCGHADTITSLLESGDRSILEQDCFGYNAIYWAERCDNPRAREILISALGSDESRPEPSQVEPAERTRFKEAACWCDVCGRCTITPLSDGVQACKECKVGDDAVFVICAFCASNGAKCRGNDHTWDIHECHCNNLESEAEDESGSGSGNGSEAEDESGSGSGGESEAESE
ncbi:ankyrin repeat protein [Purpureocillium lavendulum]|uniref:Ankyrin repeat protein n=1 Tax=Purpureocillium lavendulum TaxID=1247861 RepID=A0AB34FF37_9HYPO|nr:ankyrin repeat protein [Purpureocillium lavendulum]